MERPRSRSRSPLPPLPPYAVIAALGAIEDLSDDHTATATTTQRQPTTSSQSQQPAIVASDDDHTATATTSSQQPPTAAAQGIVVSGSDYFIPNCPPTLEPYIRWNRMPFILQQVMSFNASTPWRKIRFELAPPSGMDSSQRQLNHMLHVVNEGLNRARGRDWAFKIGITHVPWKRFIKYDYKHLPLMVLALTSENCEIIGDAEMLTISHFKECGDYRCMNIRGGKDLYAVGFSPFFTYVVFGTKQQFMEWKTPSTP